MRGFFSMTPAGGSLASPWPGCQVWRAGCLVLLGMALSMALGRASAADTLDWNRQSNRVTADIKSTDLYDVLSQIAQRSGWNVFVEPDLERTVSTKFKDLNTGDALSMMLGDLNFALIPQTNAPFKLLVFRTISRNATKAVGVKAPTRGKLIVNELVVRLKPGANIDELAKKLGGKVIGKIASLNAYRLQFADAAATEAARAALAAEPEVAAVDSNYQLDNLPNSGQVTSNQGPPPAGLGLPQLEIKPPPSTGKIIVGLVDMPVQPLGHGLDSFLLPAISVAGDSQVDPNSPSHGTSMAETMLNSIQAVTQGKTSIQILPVDVYGPNPTTSTFDVANGIAAAVNNGATVVNLSLGSDSDSPFLHSVIQDASSKNIVFFGAAGNTPVTTAFFPAAYPEVNAVTAVDQGQLASYADRGAFISFGAPGTSLISFQNQPWVTEGTSASTAFLTGVFAGYMDANAANPAQALGFVRRQFGITIRPN